MSDGVEEQEAMEEEEEEGVEGAEMEGNDEEEDGGDDGNEQVDDNLQSVSHSGGTSQEPESSSRDNVPDVDQMQHQVVSGRGPSPAAVSGPITQSTQQEEVSARRVVGPGPLMSDRPRLHSVRGHLAPFSFPPVSSFTFLFW